jgi:hypothetical protein
MRPNAKHHQASKPRPAPLTPAEIDRRAAALRGRTAAQPAPCVAPSAPEMSNITPAPLPHWLDATTGPTGRLRITATISITMTDRAARNRAEVIRAAMEALQDAQADGAADEMINAADKEGFDVERIELLATEPQVRP